MNTSTNYNFNLPEGTDLVNLLTQLIPNWSNLDTILRNVQNDTFENATELVSLGVHAISRTDPDAKLLKWVATANFTAGETFTVDGNVVAASTPAGAPLASGAYVTGVTVLAALNSDESAMTIFVSGTNVATDSERLGGELPAYYAKDSDMETVQQDITDIDNLLGNTSISAIGDGTVTGAVSAIDADLTLLDNAIANCDKWTYLTAITTAGGTYPVDFTQYKAVRIICIFSGKIDSVVIYTNLLSSTALQYRMISSAHDNIGAFNITNSAITEGGNGASLYVYVTE